MAEHIPVSVWLTEATQYTYVKRQVLKMLIEITYPLHKHIRLYDQVIVSP